MATFHIGFSGPGGFAPPRVVEASTALEAIEKAPNAITLDGSVAVVLGENPMTQHWRFVREGNAWREQ